MLPNKLWIRLSIVLVAGGAVTYGVMRGFPLLSAKPQPAAIETQKVVTVSAAAALKKDVDRTVTLTGVVQSRDSLDLAATANGTVTEVLTDVGRQVKAGDVLARLDPSAAQSALAEAVANVQAAKGRLLQQQTVTPQDLEIARTSVTIAQARLDQLKAGPSEAAVQKAKLTLQNAQSTLDALNRYEADLILPTGSLQQDMAKAQKALDLLKAGSEAVLDPAAPPLPSGSEALESPLTVAVMSAKNDLEGAQRTLQDYANSHPQTGLYDDKYESLVRAVSSAQDDLTAARANWKKAMQAAQDALDAAQTNKVETLQKLNQQIVAAQGSVASAQANLDALALPPDPNDVTQAEAALVKAQQQLELLEHPQAEGTLQSLQAAVDAAQARADAAQAALDKLTIRAPFAGTIAQRSVTVGAIAQANKPLFTLIGDLKQIAAQVDEQHLGKLQVGDAASFVLASSPDKTYAARVAQLSPTADTQTLSFNVVLVPTDASVPLTPGETASVQVVTEHLTNAVMIPSAAIVGSNGRPQVFVVRADKTVSLVDVTPGVIDGGSTQIVKGVSAGDKVVTLGRRTLLPATASSWIPIRPAPLPFRPLPRLNRQSPRPLQRIPTAMERRIKRQKPEKKQRPAAKRKSRTASPLRRLPRSSRKGRER